MPIHVETMIPAPPDRIYELLTNGAKFGEVTGRAGKGGGSEGAYFQLFGEWVDGRQVELVPGERVVQAWRLAEWTPGVFSIVRFTLQAVGEGTRLTVDQVGYPEEQREHLTTNWGPFYFEPLLKHFGRVPA